MCRELIVALVIAVAAAPAAEAAALCQRRSGALFVRASCKKKETPVDPVAIGIVGPKGDSGEARAFACSNVSADGTLVVPCAGRPSKNVVSIIANGNNTTCFVLDPSIRAASAVIVASFAEAFFGSSVNVILLAYGTDDQVGCPENSVVVTTGRYRQADAGTGMLLEAARLAVSIAVM